MTRIRSILFECSCYSGETSNERCRAVEEHVMKSVEDACRLERVVVREIKVGGGVVQPTVELVYSKGDYQRLIPLADKALSEIGVVTAKALVSTMASRAVEGAITGAEIGGLVGGVVAQGGRDRGRDAAAVLAGTLVGAALGAIGGKAAKKRELDFIAAKQAGKWHVKKFPRQGQQPRLQNP